jgi:hypothetical protein
MSDERKRIDDDGTEETLNEINLVTLGGPKEEEPHQGCHFVSILSMKKIAVLMQIA